MNDKKNKYLIFRITWVLLLLGTICDYNIASDLSFGSFSLKLQVSSLVVLLYIGTFAVIVPFREIFSVFENKFDRMNLILLGMLLVVAYISSYFSLMQKHALVHTTSRYLLFYLVLITTISYTRCFEGSAKFIVLSFVYVNLVVVTSSLSDFLIPEFNQLLTASFGHMKLNEFSLKMGGKLFARPSGFVTDTNLTALSISFSLFLMFLNQKGFNKYFMYAFSVLAGLSFGMLASRSSLILITSFIILALILKFFHWKNVWVFILLFYAVQLITPQTQARILQAFDNKNRYEESEYGRPLIWKAGLIAIGVKPILGIGSGIFFMQSDLFIARAKEQIEDDQLAIQLKDPEHVPKVGINPHNIFLTMLIEHGYGGLILFAILILYNLYEKIKHKKIASLIMLIGFMFVSLLSNYSPYYKYFLLMVVIYYVYPERNLNENGSS